MDLSFKSSTISTENKKTYKKSKYITELSSGSFLAIASILCFIVFKSPLPEGNHTQTLIICSFIGLVISFVVFVILYHLRLFYFKSLFKLFLFSFSLILLSVSTIFYIYFKSGIFL
ncbi:hypothetical protein ASG22_06175 [Chryseobacterium sp. Leaf405]|nr:hypothetical protein ASG22_06175 [Chryseobacterium sp. Leaf405]